MTAHYGLSLSQEWHTPPVYIAAVRAALGGIDLDPASNASANRVVQAGQFFDLAADGLQRPWPGRVYLNPPYGRAKGRSNQAIWSGRLLAQYAAGVTTAAVLLVTAATSEHWFRALWAHPICFSNHRIRFLLPDGRLSAGNTKGSAFVYLGQTPERFAAAFAHLGTVVRRW